MAAGVGMVVIGLLVFIQVIFGYALTRLGITQRIEAAI